MARILVGREQKVFSMNLYALVSRSRYFRGVFLGTQKNTLYTGLRMPNEDPEVFALYEQLIYNGSIPFAVRTTRGPEEENSLLKCARCERKTCDKEYQLLCGLYVLAEKFLDLDARNKAIAALHAKMKNSHNRDVGPRSSFCYPSPKAISIMYNGTIEPSYGRRLLTIGIVYHSSGDAMLPNTDLVPATFFRDIARVAMLMKKDNIHERCFALESFIAQS